MANDFRELRYALDEAAHGGQLGEINLTNFVQYTPAPQEYRALGVAALAKVKGPLGSAAMIAVLRSASPDQEDLICAAIIALVRREGRGERRMYEEMLRFPSDAVRRYAFQALAFVGEGGRWAELADELTIWEPDKGALTFGFELTVSYLLRFSDEHERGIEHVVSQVRYHWDQLDSLERQFLGKVWPDAMPGGPPLSDLRPPARSESDGWFGWIGER